jgi:hypothetical protein
VAGCGFSGGNYPEKVSALAYEFKSSGIIVYFSTSLLLE